MSDRKQPPRSRAARETSGEGVPARKRNEGPVSAEERAEPRRGEERSSAHRIDRTRDAKEPADGL